MKQFLIKAKIKDVPAGSNRIRKHIFADNEVNAINQFRDIYNQPGTIDWENVRFQTINEVII